MDISGINNAALPMMSMVSPAADTTLLAATSGLAPAAMGRMDRLVQMLQGFSSSEILMALLMTHLPARDPVSGSDDGSLATAAMALAQAMQMAGIPLGGPYMGMPAISAVAIGAQISVQG